MKYDNLTHTGLVLWDKHPSELTQVELYECVYNIATKWCTKIDIITLDLQRYILLLKIRFAYLIKAYDPENKNLDGIKEWIDNNKPSWLYYVDVISMFGKMSQYIMIRRKIKKFTIKNIDHNITQEYLYNFDNLKRNIQDYIKKHIEIESVKLNKEKIKEYISDKIIPLGEFVRYGLDHQGVVPTNNISIIQDRYNSVINSYIANSTINTNKKIYENASMHVKQDIIFYIFIRLCKQFDIDFEKELFRVNEQIMNINDSMSSIILRCMGHYYLYNDDVIYKSENNDIFDIITMWVLLISDQEFHIDDIDIIYDFSDLKKIFSMKRIKRNRSLP